MKSILGKFLKIGLPLVIGFLIIWLFTRKFTSDQIDDVLDAFKRANYGWIVLAMGLGILSHYLRAVRWKMLITPMGHNPSMKVTFFAVMIMYLANLAIHRLGEVSRCGIIHRYEGVPFQKALGTMVTERFIDLIMLVVVGACAILFQYGKILQFWNENMGDVGGKLISSWPVLLGIIIFIGIAAIIVYTTRNRENGIIVRFRRIVTGAWEGVRSVGKLQSPVKFWVTSVSIWILYLSMIFVGFYALPETSGLSVLAAFACLFIGTFGIIATPGGLGAYPALISTLLVLYGIDETIGYALGWIVWGAQTVIIITVGLLSLILLSLSNKKKIKGGSFEEPSVKIG